MIFLFACLLAKALAQMSKNSLQKFLSGKISLVFLNSWLYKQFMF